MNTIPFNINNYVRVRLTDAGREQLRRNHVAVFGTNEARMQQFPYRPPKEDADGWSKWQLWSLMHELGPSMYCGCSIPFDPIIQVEVSESERDLADWAETLLCNAECPDHSTPEEWKLILKKWRDQKHRVFPDGPGPHVCTGCGAGVDREGSYNCGTL